MKRYLVSIAVLCGLIIGLSRWDWFTALPVAELKYRVIQAVGGEPIGSVCYGKPFDDIVAHVISYGRPFLEISKDREMLQVILDHLGWAGITNSAEDQKSQIEKEDARLNAVSLEPTAGGYRFYVNYAEPSRKYAQAAGTVNLRGVVIVEAKDRPPAPGRCPLCLVGTTLIDTPAGQVPISDLREGMTVWTLNPQGERLPAPILKVAHVTVPRGHEVIHIRLSDGRELSASPGHPTADGRVLGSLTQGDTLDGAQVVSLEQLPYPDTVTYDILPAGDTGYYWANGILMGSTLALTPAN